MAGLLATAVATALLGGSVGAGARTVRELFSKDRQLPSSKVPLGGNTPLEMEVPVTEEEAEELRRQGVDVTVKRASILGAIAGPIVAGFGGTVGAYGGWQLANKIFANSRKKTLKERNDRLRKRIEDLLNDRVGPADEKLAAYMQAGEDLAIEDTPMDKKASWELIGGGLGTALGLSAIGGWRAMRKENPADSRVSALRKVLDEERRRSEVSASNVDLRPVLIVRDEEEEEERRGSPAQQARENSGY